MFIKLIKKTYKQISNKYINTINNIKIFLTEYPEIQTKYTNISLKNK